MMAWNRSSAEVTPGKKRGRKMPSMAKGIAIGLAIAVPLVAILIWFFVSGEDTLANKPQKERGMIKEVTPAPAPKAEEAPPEKKKDGIPDGWIRSSNGVLYPKGEPYRPEWTHRHQIITNNMNRVKEEVPYRNATEQILYRMFTTRLGTMPPPASPLPRKDVENLVSILIDKNESQKGDSEELALGRETIEAAKSELKKYLKEGGSPAEFLDYYNNELRKAYMRRREAIKEINRIAEEEHDVDLARKLQNEVNKRLEADGILKVKLEFDDE